MRNELRNGYVVVRTEGSEWIKEAWLAQTDSARRQRGIRSVRYGLHAPKGTYRASGCKAGKGAPMKTYAYFYGGALLALLYLWVRS